MATSPLVGFNHNIRYRGAIFHVQTEDSGLPHAHLTTHLFLDGQIIASLKTSYQDQLGHSDWPTRVRTQMETQHKQMLRDLVSGAYDARPEMPPA